MVAFLIKRLLQAIFVVIVVTLIVSFAIRLTGDPALMLTQGAGSVTEADLVRIREGREVGEPAATRQRCLVQEADGRRRELNRLAEETRQRLLAARPRQPRGEIVRRHVRPQSQRERHR